MFRHTVPNVWLTRLIPFSTLALVRVLTRMSCRVLLNQASLNFDDPHIKALIAALPQAPATARRECLARCGMSNDDYTSDDGKRNLRA